MDRILIDGTDYTVNSTGLESVAIDYGLNSNQTIDYSVTSPISLTGEAAKYLQDKFFTGCDGIQQMCTVEIYKECCDKWYNLNLTYEGIENCPLDCSVEINLQKIDEQSRCYNYLNSTIYWKRGFAENIDHAQVYYCSQPGTLLWILFTLQPVIVAILAILNVIVSVILGICNVLNLLIPGDICEPLENFQDSISICAFNELLTGCGKSVPSPLIKDILEYHADQCGLSLKSSIFQNTIYRNTVLFQLQYERGRRTPLNWIYQNGANLTVIQLLEQLKPVFNLDYRIIDGQLCVERKDFFDTLRVNVVDLESLVNEIEADDYCFKFIQQNACAFGRFEYSDDALDNQANRMRGEYDDIIEWNPENADWKEGECTTTNQFGRARFMFDQRTFESPRIGLNDFSIDNYRSNNWINIFPGCGDNRRNCDLIITDDQASLLKLLVLEDGYDNDDAKVIRKPFQTDNGTTFYEVNYPMYYTQFESDGTTERTDGLYYNFHCIDDPNKTDRDIYTADSISIPLNCDLVDIIDANANKGFSFTTRLGEGYTDELTVDYENGVLVIKDLMVGCG